MAAGDQVAFHARSVEHNSVAVDGAAMARITVSEVTGEDRGSATAEGEPADVIMQRHRLEVEVMGKNPNALRALVAATAANLVIGYKGAAGANEKHTLKNVYFSSFSGPLPIRDRDTGGKVALWGVRGIGLWGDSDTLALMWVSAADA